jgi:hypothetical protein
MIFLAGRVPALQVISVPVGPGVGSGRQSLVVRNFPETVISTFSAAR